MKEKNNSGKEILKLLKEKYELNSAQELSSIEDKVISLYARGLRKHRTKMHCKILVRVVNIILIIYQ